MKRIILALIIILTTSCNNKQTTTHIPSEKVQNEESTDTNQQEEYIVNNFTSGDVFDSDDDGITGSRRGEFEIQYYGNKADNPTESVGFVAYREGQPFTSENSETPIDCIKTVGVEFGFGMQKDFTK